MLEVLDVAFTSSELDKAISELSQSRIAVPNGVLNEFLIMGVMHFLSIFYIF